MRDYPLGLDGKGEPGGRIKILTDDDGDGRYDKATLFADGLPFPTGLHPWRDGAIIAAAPDILFLRATDGDDESDERTVLFTGFKPGNQQHRMNGFEWGLDGWIYGANGDSGGRSTA
jgi:putative membrane-bound dehydrogenase-like protein